MRDIINVSHMFLKEQYQSTSLRNCQKQASASTRDSAIKAGGSNGMPPGNGLALRVSQYPPPLDDQYWESKPIIVRAEQKVLRWLGFDVSVSKPHRAVQLLLREPKIEEALLQRRRVTYGQIVPIAWRRLNDSLYFANALRHSVMALAAASVDLAMEEIAATPSEDASCPWWLILEVTGASFTSARKDLVRATESSALGQADTSTTTLLPVREKPF